MSGLDERAAVGHGIHDSVEQRQVLVSLLHLKEAPVVLGDHGHRRSAEAFSLAQRRGQCLLRNGQQLVLCMEGQHGRGDAVARDVGHVEAQVRVADREVVKDVSADEAGRLEHPVEVHAPEHAGYWQLSQLHRAREVEFAAELGIRLRQLAIAACQASFEGNHALGSLKARPEFVQAQRFADEIVDAGFHCRDE